METKNTAPGERMNFDAITLKGIKHNSHWINSEDGDCEELINLRFKDGSWRSVNLKKTSWVYAHGCSLIHYHPLDNTESSTGEATTFFYIGIRQINDDTSYEIIAFLPGDDYEKVIYNYEHEIDEISEWSLNSGGTGYAYGDLITVSGGTGGTLRVVSEVGGVVVGLELVTAGWGYSVASGLSTTGGSGMGLTIDITEVNEEAQTPAFNSITHINNVLIVYSSIMAYYFIWDYDNKEYIELPAPELPVLALNTENDTEDFSATTVLLVEDFGAFDLNDIPGADYPDYYSKILDFISNKRKENMFTEAYVMVVVAYRLFDGSYIMHSQPILTYCGNQQVANFFGNSTPPTGYDTKYERGYKYIRSGKPILTINSYGLNLANWKGIIEGLTIFMARPIDFYSWPQSRDGYTWVPKESGGVGDGNKGADFGSEFMPVNKSIVDMFDNPFFYRVDEIPFQEIIKGLTQTMTLGLNSEKMKDELTYYLPVDNFTHHRMISEQQYIFNRRLHQGNITTIFGLADAQLFTNMYFDETVEGDGYTSDDSPLDVITFYYEVTLQTSSGKRYLVREFTPNIFIPPFTILDTPVGDTYPWEYSGSGSYSWSSASGSLNENRDPLRGDADDPDQYSHYIPVMPVISYPDYRAIRIRILGCVGGKVGGTYYELADYTLKAHPFLAMGYKITNYGEIVNDWTTSGEEFPDDYKGYLHDLIPIPGVYNSGTGQWEFNLGSIYAITTPATENRYYLDPNRLQVSRIDNPFIHEAKHSYQIGGQDAVILGVATSAVQVSDGQFGEFPLFIFTNEGVYTMRQGTDPAILYSSISPVSKERIIEGTLCEINSGIIYCTVDGVKLLSGTEVRNISDGIIFNKDNPLLTDSAYQDLLDGTTIPLIVIDTMLDDVDIRTYITGAKIAFDSYEGEIIISNPTYLYSYVYNLKYDVWFKIGQVWDYFIKIESKFYGVDGSKLHDMEEVSVDRDSTFLIQTKPLKLGSQGFKQPSRVIVRQHLEGEAEEYDQGGEQVVSTVLEGVYIYGSADGTEWKLLRGSKMAIDADGQILRVVMPMPHVSVRYLILVVAGKVIDMRFSHFEISYMNSLHNKLR